MRTFLLMVSIVILTHPASAKKPQIVVELSAIDSNISQNGLQTVEAYLILPDGTHAHGLCMTTPYENRHCNVESFTPEKRQPSQCSPKEGGGTHCNYKENYKAERKGNDITLFAANGKIAFHIDHSW